jgi:hypothetical protein
VLVTILSQRFTTEPACEELENATLRAHAADRGLNMSTPIARSRLPSRLASQRNLYLLERQSIMRMWLRDAMLSLPLERDFGHSERVQNHGDRLASIIRQLFYADSCALYRYDAVARTLDRFGLFPAVTSTPEQRSHSFDEIRGPGQGLQRDQLPAYRAVDRGQVQRVDDAHDSAVAVPIAVFGRPWGVLEINGARARQFPPEAERWLEEVARLITPHLFYEWVLSRFYVMDQIVLAARGTEDLTGERTEQMYQRLVSEIAGIFMASSASLYLRDRRLTTEFYCEGSVGRTSSDGQGCSVLGMSGL